MRGATLFSGGGGVEALLKERIGFVHAVEYDSQIAAVYRQNHGDHIQVAKVEDVDYSLWGALDYLHASPVCKNASQAKTGGAESETDVQTALAVVRCLEATQPRVFTLENVWGYRNFKAFKRICAALDHGGYMWHFEHLNAATCSRAACGSKLKSCACSRSWPNRISAGSAPQRLRIGRASAICGSVA